jgi:hypothetical protein
VLSGTWLVVTPAGDLAERCVRAMESRGARVAVIEVPAGQAGRETLAAAVSGIPGLCGVVSLLGPDQTPVPGHPAVTAGLAATLALVQALGDAGTDAPLWLLTRGAVAAGTTATPDPVQAQVWGLGLVANQECPDRWGGLIDLPPVLDERAAARLCGVLAGCGEDQVAIRDAGIMARRLTRAPLPRGAGDRWVPRGSVLITGGTGAIGGHVARWLARNGAPHLVLASRSGPAAPGAAALAADLAMAGSQVTVSCCDLAERSGRSRRRRAGGPAGRRRRRGERGRV